MNSNEDKFYIKVVALNTTYNFEAAEFLFEVI